MIIIFHVSNIVVLNGLKHFCRTSVSFVNFRIFRAWLIGFYLIIYYCICRYSMTHASVPADLRKQLGITEGFIRISVGLESEADLISDLSDALDNC